jgi:hypothetical protein
MTKRRTLIKLLQFLGRLLQEPASTSTLSPTKFTAARLEGALLEARGWRYLAGYSTENIDELTALIGDTGMSTLLRNRQVAESDGRPIGSKAKQYADKDAAIIADIRKGVSRPEAIKARYRISKQYRTHSKRIKRKMDAQDAETREIIRLQTPYIRAVDIK